MTFFAQQTVNGIALGSVFALLALGVTLVWGVLNVLNFAHAQFMTWGAFGTAFGVSRGYPVILCIAIGIATAALLALVVDEVIVTPLKRRPSTDPSGFVVATIGVGLILETLIKMASNSELRAFSVDGIPQGSVTVAGVSMGQLQLTILGTTLAVMVALGLWLSRSRRGRELRTVAYSQEVAELLGINTRVSFAIAFIISGALAALAGTFVGEQTAIISFSSGDNLLLITFAAIVIGGMGSVPGSVLGGLVLGLGQVLTGAYVSDAVSNVIPFALMVAVLLFRPTGLIRQQVVARA